MKNLSRLYINVQPGEVFLLTCYDADPRNQPCNNVHLHCYKAAYIEMSCRDEPVSVCAISQNLRTNSAPICHETAWRCMNLHIGKVLKYEYYG